MLDGEIVLVGASGDRLDFDALQQRIHPAASRVKLLAEQTPAKFVAFDLLALDDEDLTGRPFSERRAALEKALAGSSAPVHLTAATRDNGTAEQWFRQFEGAGLDGIVAKSLDGTYQPDKRVMLKIKHERTADCVLAGYRVHTSGPDRIGSLLLGLYDGDGELASVGVVGAFPMQRRKELFEELQPLVTDFDDHPWAWAKQEEGEPDAAQRRRQPVERRQGPVLHPAAPRAGAGSEVRPHGRRAVPPHRPVCPLAAGPGPGILHLRAAGGAGEVRPRRGAGHRPAVAPAAYFRARL